jgi:pimeloyl-ACP methyl ester carboxylesterase
VLLQHGLIDSSFTWIFNEPYESLAYILADAGFDVWMGNNRGNQYSKNHTYLNPTSSEFWQFTYDQMAQYDFPAMVEYILSETGNSKMGFVGHSEGTMQVFAGLSRNPEFAQNLNAFVGLGPVATVGHITNLFFKFLADTDVQDILLFFGEKQFLPNSKLLDDLFPGICRATPGICDDVIEFICGPHKGAFNNSRMQVMGANEPSGTSVLNMAHFAQAIKKDTFEMYDYGSRRENEKHYNQSKPPVYDLSNFPSSTLPVAMWYGTEDELADPTDVAYLIGHLPTPPQIAVELNQYAHLDYVWDYTAYQLFYPDLVQFLTNYSTLGLVQN